MGSYLTIAVKLSRYKDDDVKSLRKFEYLSDTQEDYLNSPDLYEFSY